MGKAGLEPATPQSGLAPSPSALPTELLARLEDSKLFSGLDTTIKSHACEHCGNTVCVQSIRVKHLSLQRPMDVFFEEVL